MDAYLTVGGAMWSQKKSLKLPSDHRCAREKGEAPIVAKRLPMFRALQPGI